MAECAVEKTVEAPAVEVVSPPSVTEKRSHTNGHASPVCLPTNHSSPAGKPMEVMTPPIVSEKRPQTNGHASPVRMPANPSSPSGKQYLEGHMKTDDRMRLAKERREEREKSLAARDQAIREKERRAQVQYERTVEERGRRLEEQRQREELRRAAVEEKRRQRLEEEKERLEALMRRSLERSLQLEQRPKRWTWGSPGGTREGDCENVLPLRSTASALPHELAAPLSAASEFSNAVPTPPLSNLPMNKDSTAEEPFPGVKPLPRLAYGAPTSTFAADSLSASAMTLSQPLDPPLSKRLSSSAAAVVHTERAPPSPHRSPYRGSPSRGNRRKASAGSPGLSEANRGSTSSPETLKTEKLRRERRTSSPGNGSPLRRPESPATASVRPASPAASRMMSKGWAQSPCTTRDYPPSPLRHRADGKKRRQEGERGDAVQDLREEEARGHKPLEKTFKTATPDEKTLNMETSEKKPSKFETPEKNTLTVETPEKRMQKSSSSDLSGDRSAEPSPLTPTGKPVAGTTDAEEASRLLAERRRQARLQKELEDKQRREQDEEERVRVEELRRRQVEARARQKEEARRVEAEKQRQEQERRQREKEERRHRESRERELQIQTEREREEGELQAQKEVERHRQEREGLKLQEEQERMQRKKRIEEIMKRTRKTDAELKKEEGYVEPPSPLPAPQGPIQVNAPLNAQVNGRVDGPPLVPSGDKGGAAMAPTTSPAPVPLAAPQPVPLIHLEPLEVQTGVGEEADEVQSMEVSPVCKEELVSIPEFSPVDEVHRNGVSNARALEDLLDLTGHVAYPKLSPGANLGDCNRNLIEGLCRPAADPRLTRGPSPDKRNV